MVLIIKKIKVAWLREIFERLLKKFGAGQTLSKIAHNLLWLTADKFIRLLIALVVGIWMARYLGPACYGELNYAIAIVTLFAGIASLGLNSTVVRDLVESPDEHDVVLGTAFLLQLIGGGGAFALSLAFVFFSNPVSSGLVGVVAVLAGAAFFKSLEVIRYWYEARIESKIFVRVELLAFVFCSALKVLLILLSASLMAFAWVITLESSIIAAGLVYVYIRSGKTIWCWHWNWSRGVKLLRDSWPMILSGLAVSIYMRIDQLMLGGLLGSEAVGVYSAAVRMTEIWYMIPMMVAGTIYPLIIQAKSFGDAIYYDKLSRIFSAMGWLSILAAIVTSLFSGQIINFLYGASYGQAAEVLAIQVWSGVFVFSGIIAGRWFLAERLQVYLFYRALGGVFANVLLNALLIPRIGLVGAAWAALISNAFSGVFINAFFPKTRNLFVMQMRGIFSIFFGLRNIIK